MRIEDLNLSALKYFLDSVEFESITRSAQHNNVSRAAVSQAIIRLGEWYGKKLLVHKKRGFALTDEGKAFYRLAKSNFANFSSGFAGSINSDDDLRLGYSVSLFDLIFPKISGLVASSRELVVKTGPTDTLLSLIDQKIIHIGFFIESKPITNFRTRVFHRGNFELRSQNGRVKELLVTTEQRPEVNSYLSFCASKKVKPSRHLEVESWTHSQNFSRVMNGMCLVPDCITKGDLKSIETKSWSFPYRAVLVYQKDALLTKIEQEVIEKFCK